MKKQYQHCTVSRDDRTIKSCFSIKVLHKQLKGVIVTHFTMKIIHTHLYITCNKKMLKNILVYCGYSATFPFFLLLS